MSVFSIFKLKNTNTEHKYRLVPQKDINNSSGVGWLLITNNCRLVARRPFFFNVPFQSGFTSQHIIPAKLTERLVAP